MSFWMIVLVMMNILLGAGLIATWIRSMRTGASDPRLSKGLQLLQSKISVLEDLSDKTDLQVQKIIQLMDQKCKEVQAQLGHAEKIMMELHEGAAQMTESAADTGPSEEKVKTAKYVRAAQLAQQGLSPLDIARELHLNVGEVEFITKVNQQELQFCEDSLPVWTKNPKFIEDETNEFNASTFEDQIKKFNPDYSSALQAPQVNVQRLKQLSDELKNANRLSQEAMNPVTPTAQAPLTGAGPAPTPRASMTSTPAPAATSGVRVKDNVVRPVVFKRVDV